MKLISKIISSFQVIPRCPKCPTDEPEGIMKPDIVFFGESLPDQFHKQMEIDKDECDLLIVMGSSLKVRPVALIPSKLFVNTCTSIITSTGLKKIDSLTSYLKVNNNIYATIFTLYTRDEL